jgi:hypothetical protein
LRGISALTVHIVSCSYSRSSVASFARFEINHPNPTNLDMNSLHMTRYSILSLTALLCATCPSLHAQTPIPATNFNDSVGIFRETTASDWPALFLSPFPYSSQTQTLKGLSIFTMGYSAAENNDGTSVFFNVNTAHGMFQWMPSTLGSTMELDENGGLGLECASGVIYLSPSEGKIVINYSTVLTDASLLQPLHFSRISMGTGSVANAANAFAAGNNTSALGLNSAAFGVGTSAAANQFVLGQYNAAATGGLLVVGNGTSATSPSNAFVVNQNGDVKISGRLTSGFQASAATNTSLALGDFSNAGGEFSSAIGPQASTSGDGSVAIGWGSSAYGEDAVALGRNAQVLGGGTALGSGSQAEGGAVAIGGGIAMGQASLAFGASTTTGLASRAMGFSATASGFASMSMGRGTIAQGLNQVTLGQYNIAAGTPHNSWDLSERDAWDPGDEILIVGNGQSDTTRSNALTVKKNAAMGVGTGIVTTTASQTVVGKYNDSSVSGLFVVGMGPGTGTTPRKNALRVREDGTLLVRPAGDILMGDFQTGEQP